MTEISAIWIALAAVVGIVFFSGRRRRAGRPSRSDSVRIDVEADLLQACQGDRRLADRLIARELEDGSELSRAGAALMALARLRDDQR
jgi:hypothetical protein